MAGKKGRSGRKSNANEDYRLQTIEECWRLVRDAINDTSLDYQFRVELAAKHTVKAIPTELAGSFTAKVSAMGTIEKVVGNKVTEALRFNIGSPDPSKDS